MPEIIKKHKDESSLIFESFSFVTAIIDLKDDYKFIYRHLHSTGDEIVATNSRVLIIDKTKMDKGNFELLKRNRKQIWLHQSEDIIFPKYKKLLPTEKELKESYTQIKYFQNHPAHISRLIKTCHKEAGIDSNLLKYLNIYAWTAYIPQRANTAFVFKCESKTVLIMPVRLRWDLYE